MSVLNIISTHQTPSVYCDSDKGLIEIKGKSLPENSNFFYEPIMQWVEGYTNAPQKKTTVNFHFEYLNTSSSKHIFDLFLRFASLKKKSYDVEINWLYTSEEEDMLESGKDYQAVIDIPFNYIEIEEGKIPKE